MLGFVAALPVLPVVPVMPPLPDARCCASAPGGSPCPTCRRPAPRGTAASWRIRTAPGTPHLTDELATGHALSAPRYDSSTLSSPTSAGSPANRIRPRLRM